MFRQTDIEDQDFLISTLNMFVRSPVYILDYGYGAKTIKMNELLETNIITTVSEDFVF